VTASFNNVALCGTGMPSGGSLTVSGQGNAGGVNINNQATVAFGPVCGTAKLGS